MTATSPSAHPDNVLVGDNWRISVLDAGLVRLQWSPSGQFEDRASQAIWHRDLPPVEFTTHDGDVLEILTERFHLIYDRREFSNSGLSVQVRGDAVRYGGVWRFGDPDPHWPHLVNLGGTARTLDAVDGATELEPGVLARSGFATYDDSDTVLLDGDWFAEREPGSIDLYVFSYGHDFRAALQTLYAVTGPQPLLPRWAFGNWWSRYHPYTAGEYLDLMDRFDAERLPFSVGVLDMDWHLVDIDPRYGTGWTGYTWNRELLGEPAEFLAALHARGLRTTLNVHPADGIRAFEECYPAVAEVMGLDPASELPVSFDPTSQRFLRAYFEQVHHPLEELGVDFWWLDWQQGRTSRIKGLDPLWLLNHLHFLDTGRADGPMGKRPMTFSRYAGLGSHRYPVGFSGDTVVSWDSLAFQPEFTARASNVGYGWWSHDVGGHMFGVKDDELATRWVQLGVFSPILRLHSTLDAFNSKEPWRFNAIAEQVMGRFLRLRHQLVPYLATMNCRAREGSPLVSPMYYDHADAPESFEFHRQFYFGTSLLVAPIVQPADRRTLLGRVDAWLPPGDWVDLFTGVAYAGDRRVALHRSLDSIPVLATAGTVLPLVAQEAVGNDTAAPEHVEVWVVAGADGEFTLVEDADDDAWASTPLRFAAGTLTIGRAEGDLASLPTERAWSVIYVGTAESPEGASPGPVPNSWRLDLGTSPVIDTVQVVLGSHRLVGAEVVDLIWELLDRAQVEFVTKAEVWRVIEKADTLPGAVLALQSMALDPALLTALSELLLARPE